MQSVAWLESNYGRAPGQHAKWAALGLYTWGNIEKGRDADGGCDEADGWYPGTDAGNARCFKLDKTDEAAAERYIRTMIAAGNINSTDARTRAFAERSSNIKAALHSGSPTRLAEAMVTPKSVAYYEAPPSKYAEGLTNALAGIDKAVPRAIIAAGKPLPSAESSAPSGEASRTVSGAFSTDALDRAALDLTSFLIMPIPGRSTRRMGEVTSIFQTAHGGLKIDGIYGPATYMALISHIGSKFNLKGS